MLLLFQLFGKKTQDNSPFTLSSRISREFTKLRGRLKLRGSPVSLLLFLLSCYIVTSRIGPLVNKASCLAIETFEVERRIVEEFDYEGLKLFREVFNKFRVVTRAPFPFGRVSHDNLLVNMGNRSSTRRSKGPAQQPTTTTTTGEQDPNPSDQVASKAGIEPLEGTPNTEKPSDSPADAPAEDKEEAGEVSDGEKDAISPAPSDPKASPLPRRLADIRKDSEMSLRFGSTESMIGIFQPRLDPTEIKKPIKFKEIQTTIRTGDLALLYRKGQEIPHVAVFINHSGSDPLFPLLLVKGKTKPMSMSNFDPSKRFIHPITATTRIFYGDYEKVAIQYLETEVDMEIDAERAMQVIDEVEKIPFSEKEREAIASARTDHERSLFVCSFMAAYYYQKLGVFAGKPDEITPDNFREHLPLLDPIEIRLPSVKLGPMVHGEPPFLKQIVDGIYPAQHSKMVPYNQAIQGLDTGDLILFSGATSQGAIIKFFDHSEFSHVALILKAKYTSQLLIWEASTNHAELVDVQSGHVRTGVEVLPLRNKVFSGWYDRIAIRRLVGISPEKRQQIYKEMLKLRKEWMNRPYEKNMIQMALSAINPSDTFLSLFQNTCEDLTSLFCSELVGAAYQRMGLIKGDRPSNTYTPDDFSSSRDSKILCDGVTLSPEEHIELKFPPTLLSTQESVY